jgi:RES domain-containing protein
MIIYRIAHEERIRDLRGTGAKITGGRWNPKGMAVLYTSSSASLAILEKLVHVDRDLLPSGLVIAEIEIEDGCTEEELKPKDLPPNWQDYPSPDILKDIGKEWLEPGRSLLLKVPSAVNPLEINYLINPLHGEMGKVKLGKIHPLTLDSRL